MYCKNCGKLIDDNCYCCDSCGTPLKKENSLNEKNHKKRRFYSDSDEKYDAETKKHIKMAVIFSFISVTLAIFFSISIGLVFLVLNDNAAMIVSVLSAIPGMIFSVLSSKNLKKISNDYKEDNLRNIILIKILDTFGFVISFIRLAFYIYITFGFFAIVFLMESMS